MPSTGGRKARARAHTLDAAADAAAASPVSSAPAGEVVTSPFSFPAGAEPAWVPVRPLPGAKSVRAAKSPRKATRKYGAMRVTWPASDGGGLTDAERAAAATASGANGNLGVDQAPRVYEVAVGDFALMRTGEGPGGRLFVAQITSIYLTAGGAVEVDVRWMYRPEDAVGSPDNQGAGDVELYDSSHEDAHQDAPCIIGKAAVTSFERFMATREAAGPASTATASDPPLHYYVSFSYDYKKQVFTPTAFEERDSFGAAAGGAAGGAKGAKGGGTGKADAAATPAKAAADGNGTKAGEEASTSSTKAATPAKATPAKASAAKAPAAKTAATAGGATPSTRPARSARPPPRRRRPSRRRPPAKSARLWSPPRRATTP